MTRRSESAGDAEVQAGKRRLRDAMRRRSGSVAPEQAAIAAASAARSLMDLDLVKRGMHVGMFAALPDEIPTRVLFDAVVAAGAIAMFPRTRPGQALEFCAIERWENLSSAAYGLLEPPLDRRGDSLGDGDLVVVPGVAFDPAGHRLGRGKAYYDRTFPPDSATSGVLIGYGYEFQVVEAVPHERHDRKMDVIVTDGAVRHCG